MNAEAILKRIEDDAKKLSADILNDAKSKVNQMQYNSHLKVEKLKFKTEKMAEVESDEIRKQLQSMNDLEYKKYLLQQRRSLIDEAFIQAKDKIKSLPLNEISNKVVGIIVKQAEGGETLYVGANQADWLSDALFNDINNKLKAQNKLALIKGDKQIENATGAVLVKEGVELNCTIESLLDYLRVDIERDVAERLFTNQ
ncbi:MAG: hypothetical protein GYA87_04990 [Christensenellaceae bacterium]|nr:hypothetical protein [Christensenellaceae bacterium]